MKRIAAVIAGIIGLVGCAANNPNDEILNSLCDVAKADYVKDAKAFSKALDSAERVLQKYNIPKEGREQALEQRGLFLEVRKTESKGQLDYRIGRIISAGVYQSIDPQFKEVVSYVEINSTCPSLHKYLHGYDNMLETDRLRIIVNTTAITEEARKRTDERNLDKYVEDVKIAGFEHEIIHVFRPGVDEEFRAYMHELAFRPTRNTLINLYEWSKTSVDNQERKDAAGRVFLEFEKEGLKENAALAVPLIQIQEISKKILEKYK